MAAVIARCPAYSTLPTRRTRHLLFPRDLQHVSVCSCWLEHFMF